MGVLFEIIMSGSLLILFIIILRKLLIYKISHKLFIQLWNIVLIRLLLPIKIPLEFSIFNSLPKIQSAVMIVDVSARNAMLEIPNYKNIIIIVWFVAAVMIFFRFVFIHLRNVINYKTALPMENEYIDSFIKKNGVGKNIKILCSDRVMSPLVYGFFRPKIILTNCLDYKNSKEINNILSHELMHIKNKDIFKRYLLMIVVSVYWFNPFIWFMYLFLPRDLEIYCDECTIKNFSNDDKKKYAKMLIDLAEEKRNVLTANFLESKKSKKSNESEIKERIVCIMKNKKNIHIVASLAVTLAIVAFFFTSVKANSKVEFTGEISDETRYYAFMDYDSADDETKKQIIEARRECLYAPGGSGWSINGELSITDEDGSVTILPKLKDIFPDWDIDILIKND